MRQEILDSKPEGLDFNVYRPVWLPSLVFAVLLLVSLSLMVFLAWRSHERLVPVHKHMDQLQHLQALDLRLEKSLFEGVAGNKDLTERDRRQLRAALTSIDTHSNHLVGQTPARLQTVATLMTKTGPGSSQAHMTALSRLREVLHSETRAHHRLLNRVRRTTSQEFELSTFTLAAFPLLAMMILYLLRRRIFVPLRQLSHVMWLLADQTYRSVSTQGIDPLLKPLTDNYNNMVLRLAAFEQDHANRRETLENQVRTASQTLLEQQRTLADTEQLAAVGEVAAQIAHELRNPLASIEMSLSNLRDDSTSHDYAARLDRVITELNRITLLMENLLDQSRHNPEPPAEVRLAQTIDDLLMLTRYQVPDRIELRADIPADLVCCLPQDRLRQTVLNLVLNASQAMGNERGTILVQARQAGSHLRLAVCDDGCGFPEAIIHRDIQWFNTRRAKGSGLGLAMVRRFVHHLNGELKLSNRETRGACVTLMLPCGHDHG